MTVLSQNSIYQKASKSMINYSIEQIGEGYTLTIWEPAPTTGDRVKPFFFKANYTISSPLEAFGLVKLVQGGKGLTHKTSPISSRS